MPLPDFTGIDRRVGGVMCEFPESWAAMDVRDAVVNITITDNKIPQKEYLNEGDYPVFDQGHDYIGGYTNNKEKLVNCKLPVIVFGDHTRSIKLVNQSFAPGADGIKVLQPQSFFNPRLFEYFARHIATHLTNHGYARHYQYLVKSTIPLPPTNEQHRIVAKIEELFSELDKGIENLKTAQAQLKVYRQALLKHAFEGKLTAQWRAENRDKLESAEVLLKRIQQERAQRFQQQLADWEKSKSPSVPLLQRGKKTDAATMGSSFEKASLAVPPFEKGGGGGISKPKAPKPLEPLTAEELAELPELPEGWGWIRLGDVFSNSPKNGIYKSADYYGTGFSIIRIDDFYDGILCRTSHFKKVKLSIEEIKAFTAHVGDILINRVNSIEYLGKCCEIKGLAEPVVFESNIMKTTLDANLVSNFFVTSYLSSHFGRRRLCANAKHAVNQASINQTDVSLTPLPLAQLDEQIAISERLGVYLSEIDQLDQTITTSLQQAEALRQSILKKAFSGQLVPQDPYDEPASALLARIKAERATAEKSSVVRQRGRKARG